MHEQRYYNVRNDGEQLIIMSGHVAEPVIECWTEYSDPAQLAQDANRTAGCRTRGAEVLSHAELQDTPTGRDALRRYYEIDDSAWHDAAVKEIRDQAEATLSARRDKGDDVASVVLEEGTLSDKLRYAESVA